MRPGMIQFGKLDLAEDPSRFGCYPAMVGSSQKKYYPSLFISDRDKPIDLPASGVAKINYKVTRREENTRDGKVRHSATLDVLSIETGNEPDKKPKLAGAAKKIALSDLRPGMIHFDSRPRNGNGQFVANETGGADPNSMQAAYGGAIADNQRRSSIMQKIKSALRIKPLGAPTAPIV